MSVADAAHLKRPIAWGITLGAFVLQFLPLLAIKFAYVQTTSRLGAGVVAVVVVASAFLAWRARPAVGPRWFNRLTSFVLLTWACVLTLFLGTSLLLAAPLELKREISLDGQIVRAYVGCDGTTTDPCVVVRQEWSLAPGLVQTTVLYRAWGREFTLDVAGPNRLRVVAPEFVGERRRPAEARELTLVASPSPE